MRTARCVLPDADVIVNPNQPGCGFASKSIAGVGVMFYVLLALRARAARARRVTTAATQPRLDALLDLVALGTVADVVRLDANNRRLVAQGLKRIRAGRMQPGVAALFAAAGRDAARAAPSSTSASRSGRASTPPGRLADMTLGIECLLTDDAARAARAGRRSSTPSTASGATSRPACASRPKRCSAELARRQRAGRRPLALFDPGFHEGVVGIVAGRVKDRWHRPTFVFARGSDGLLKGSGRSIAGFHLRDALDLVSKRQPGAAAALRRPRDGRRLHAAGGRRCRRFDAARCSRWPPSGSTPRR